MVEFEKNKKTLYEIAKKYNFDINTKIYGVFAYWQQPALNACYLLTNSHQYAIKVNKKKMRLNFSNYDVRGFHVTYGTIDELFLKHAGTMSGECVNISDMFLNYLARQKDENSDNTSNTDSFGDQLSNIKYELETLIDRMTETYDLDKDNIIPLMREIKDMVENFTIEDEESVEW